MQLRQCVLRKCHVLFFEGASETFFLTEVEVYNLQMPSDSVTAKQAEMELTGGESAPQHTHSEAE